MRAPRPVPFIVLLALAAACGSGRSASQARTAPAVAAGSYRFDWSPPCRVPVRELIEKKGKKVLVSYAVDVRPGAAGDLEVRLEDHRILSIDGQDVTGPEWREPLAATRAMMAAIPVVHVSREGAYLGADGAEEMVDKALALVGLHAEEAAKVRQAMLAPEMLASLEIKMGDTWRTWVETWVGWDVAPGQPREGETVLALAGGVEVPLGMRLEHLGVVDGYARLKVTSVLEGEALVKSIGPMMEAMARNLGQAIPTGVIAGGRRETVITVETDPRTLRPRRTRTHMQLEVQLQDGSRRSQVEVHDIEWSWARARGCGAR